MKNLLLVAVTAVLLASCGGGDTGQSDAVDAKSADTTELLMVLPCQAQFTEIRGRQDVPSCPRRQ
jgi:hypothetical protein